MTRGQLTEVSANTRHLRYDGAFRETCIYDISSRSTRGVSCLDVCKVPPLQMNHGIGCKKHRHN